MSGSETPRSRGFLLFAAVVILVVAFAAARFWPENSGGLDGLPRMSTILGLVRGTLAAFCAWISSRALDHVGARLPGPMSAAFGVILSDPRAAGTYYGLRFAGLCYIYGAAL